MIVKELIAALQLLPLDADVLAVYDGSARTPIEVVWKAQANKDDVFEKHPNGRVLLAEIGDVVYDDEDRPVGAPSSITEPYWCVR